MSLCPCVPILMSPYPSPHIPMCPYPIPLSPSLGPHVPTPVCPWCSHAAAVSPCPRVPQFGRTEVIDNTLNPDFLRKFVLDYFFEEKQNLRFDL